MVYTVPNDPSVTYNWSYSGTGVTINGTTNSVTVDFSSTATNGTLSVTATNSCGTSAARAIAITVNPLPTPAIAGPTSACSASAGNMYTTTAGMTNYLWTITGGTITSGGGTTDNTVTVTWGAAGTGHVQLNYTNSNGCLAVTATDQPVTITPLPDTGPVYRKPNN